MGLDIHRDVIVACLLKGPVGTKPLSEVRTFSKLIAGMQELREWVLQSGCQYIAMESTGIYWHSVYETLETCFDGNINLLVLNARHMKNVPGKKTDIRDSEWIAALLRACKFPPTTDILNFYAAQGTSIFALIVFVATTFIHINPLFFRNFCQFF